MDEIDFDYVNNDDVITASTFSYFLSVIANWCHLPLDFCSRGIVTYVFIVVYHTV